MKSFVERAKLSLAAKGGELLAGAHEYGTGKISGIYATRHARRFDMSPAIHPGDYSFHLLGMQDFSDAFTRPSASLMRLRREMQQADWRTTSLSSIALFGPQVTVETSRPKDPLPSEFFHFLGQAMIAIDRRIDVVRIEIPPNLPDYGYDSLEIRRNEP